MTVNEALQFLRDHQPLPPTREIHDDLLQRFDEVRKFFLENPDSRCVKLLLNSFGEGDGHGVYQLVEDTILLFDAEIVVPELVEGLHSNAGSVRYWCAQLSANFHRQELVAPLVTLLIHGGHDERVASVTALESIGTTQAREALRNALAADIEADVKDMIRDALSETDQV